MEALQDTKAAVPDRRDSTEYNDDYWFPPEQRARLRKHVFWLAKENGLTLEDAEESWQDVKMVLYNKVVNKEYDSSIASLNTLGSKIAYYKIKEIARRFNREPQTISIDEIAYPGSNGRHRDCPDNPESILLQVETINQNKQSAMDAMNTLVPEEAEIIRQRFYEGEQIRDIAVEHGVNPNTMSKRVSRILERLRGLVPPD